MNALRVPQPYAWAIVSKQSSLLNVDDLTDYEDLVGEEVAIYASKHDSILGRFLVENRVRVARNLKGKVDKVLGVATVKDIVGTSQSRWFLGPYAVTFSHQVAFSEPFVTETPPMQNIFEWVMPDRIEIPEGTELVKCPKCDTKVYEVNKRLIDYFGYEHKASCGEVVLARKLEQEHRITAFMTESLNEHFHKSRQEIAIALSEVLEDYLSDFMNDGNRMTLIKAYAKAFNLTQQSSVYDILPHIVSLEAWQLYKDDYFDHWELFSQAQRLVFFKMKGKVWTMTDGNLIRGYTSL